MTVGCSADYTLGRLPGTRGSDQPIAPVSTQQGIYATDGRVLYTLAPDTGVFSASASFHGCDLNVVEITLDDTGGMYAAGFENGFGALYAVNASTGSCSTVRRFPTDASWSLGFLGKGLFGDESGSLVRLDTKNGMQTIVMATVSSKREGCDIVQRADGSTYLSVLLDRTSATPSNVLEWIDPEAGRVLEQYAIPDDTVLEGLAEAGGVLYGFGRDGRVFRIALEPGMVELRPIVTVGGPARFTGAASMFAPSPR